MDDGESAVPTAGLVAGNDAGSTDESVQVTVTALAAESTVGDPEAVLDADPDVVVAVGESAVRALSRRRPDQPILPVDAGSGLQSVPRDAVAAALERFGSPEWETASHALLSVRVDGESVGRALFDAGLVTAEPARISEYTIATDDEPIASLRADGVVAATPAGTGGYARAVGSPLGAPGTDVLSVSPIAPFATDPDAWIVPDDGVTVTVERDETPVAVLADDRAVAEIGPDEPVAIGRDGTVRTVVVPESTSPFAREDGRLEKH